MLIKLLGVFYNFFYLQGSLQFQRTDIILDIKVYCQTVKYLAIYISYIGQCIEFFT